MRLVYNSDMKLTETGCEVDGNGSGSYPVLDFGITDVETSGYGT
jgi:hypothetical protein